MILRNEVEFSHYCDKLIFDRKCITYFLKYNKFILPNIFLKHSTVYIN